MKVDKLLEDIFSILKPFDGVFLNELIDSIPNRKQAISEIKRTDYTGKFATDYYANARVEAAGGITWFKLINGNSIETIENKLRTIEKTKIEVRNSKIKQKLLKAGIVDVISLVSNTSEDGFTGSWNILTNTGNKLITLDIITAGGYNVQCIHNRIMVNIK